ncbi:MAG: hypothetical protein EGQ46_02735, partial [Clostridiales bacterium]|nr:hypothetical protein [Clostridiales bacterium]
MKRTGKKFRWNYTALAFAIPCVGMLFVMLISKYEPFGKYSMLYSDMYHQYYPFFVAFRRAIRSGSGLLYTWSVGMGMDYLGLISYYLASPLNLLSVLVPEGWLLEFFSLLVPVNEGQAKPANFDPTKKYPVIMHQYSGPGSQQVTDSWSIGSMGNGGLFDYYLTQKGYIIVSVDGRGTGGRGAEFEKCTYLNIGDLESKDQVEAAIWLGKQDYIDASRIGIWGWSYGGFCTLMSMSEGRPVFKAGVSIAPPTNWRFYDSIYTERFMRTPQENPTGYALNPLVRAKNLHGRLLLCHGLADDNVHPQNVF